MFDSKTLRSAVLLVAMPVMALVGCSQTVHGTGPSASYKLLSHRAVEHYIEAQMGVKHVVCNHGLDFPMVLNYPKLSSGEHFTCTAADGKRFSVKITNPDTGNYVVG